MYCTQTDRAAALAAIVQAATLVDSIARRGECDDDALLPLVRSLFVVSPDRVSDVYHGFSQLSLGRDQLKKLFTQRVTPTESTLLRYALTLIHLERKLSGNGAMMTTIRQRLERCRDQVNHFGYLHENIYASLADAYLATISTYKKRLQVNGEAHFLQNPAHTTKIRTALFAGFRSAMLWHQLGGRRWHLLLCRKSVLDAIEKLQ